MEDDGAYWPPVDASMFFNSCYRVMLWQIQASAAEALGYTSDAARCRAKLATSRRAVHNAFYRTDTPMYVLDEQPYLAYALLCGIVPREVKARVEARLTQRITQACDYHVESGVLGTAYLIQYLLESGRSDLLYAMVSQTTYPGWGYMVEQGATTAWEQWNGNFSHIHGSYLSLDAWFFQGIAGIRPDPAAPGFKHIVVKPEVGGDLAWAKAEYLSIHGMIASHWHRDGGELVFDVTVPPNTTASIHIPGTGARCASASLPSARRQNRRSIFTAQPGSYRFVSREK
jgi:alpha-L-rhamnosidase